MILAPDIPITYAEHTRLEQLSPLLTPNNCFTILQVIDEFLRSKIRMMIMNIGRKSLDNSVIRVHKKYTCELWIASPRYEAKLKGVWDREQGSPMGAMELYRELPQAGWLVGMNAQI